MTRFLAALLVVAGCGGGDSLSDGGAGDASPSILPHHVSAGTLVAVGGAPGMVALDVEGATAVHFIPSFARDNQTVVAFPLLAITAAGTVNAALTPPGEPVIHVVVEHAGVMPGQVPGTETLAFLDALPIVENLPADPGQTTRHTSAGNHLFAAAALLREQVLDTRMMVIQLGTDDRGNAVLLDAPGLAALDSLVTAARKDPNAQWSPDEILDEAAIALACGEVLEPASVGVGVEPAAAPAVTGLPLFAEIAAVAATSAPAADAGVVDAHALLSSGGTYLAASLANLTSRLRGSADDAAAMTAAFDLLGLN